MNEAAMPKEEDEPSRYFVHSIYNDLDVFTVLAFSAQSSISTFLTSGPQEEAWTKEGLNQRLENLIAEANVVRVYFTLSAKHILTFFIRHHKFSAIVLSKSCSPTNVGQNTNQKILSPHILQSATSRLVQRTSTRIWPNVFKYVIARFNPSSI